MGRRSGQDTRARIAEVALALLREKGASGLTMRQVAARAELALSNVQYHYGSREALLRGLTEHHLVECRQSLARGLEREEATSLRAVLEVNLCDPEVQASASAFRELFALARTEPAVRERLEAHYREMFEAAVEQLGGLSAQPRDRLEEVATVLMTSIEGAYLLGDITPVTGARLAAVLDGVARAMLAAGPVD